MTATLPRFVWSTTAHGTRVIMDTTRPEARRPHMFVRLGHVRNVAPNQWYAESYETQSSNLLPTLNEAKDWLLGVCRDHAVNS